MQNEPCFSIRVLLMGTRWFKWREVECMREVHRGCRETVAGDFCFDFCDPKRGFADPARVARGWQARQGCHRERPHTPHQIWNPACEEFATLKIWQRMSH